MPTTPLALTFGAQWPSVGRTKALCRQSLSLHSTNHGRCALLVGKGPRLSMARPLRARHELRRRGGHHPGAHSHPEPNDEYARPLQFLGFLHLKYRLVNGFAERARERQN